MRVSIENTMRILRLAPRQLKAVLLDARFLAAVVLICSCGVLRGQVSTAQSGKANRTDTSHSRVGARIAAGRNEYVIDADDVLEVDVVDAPEFSRNYRVSPDGTITIPLLAAPVTAEGLTLGELSAVISDRLRSAQLVSHPSVIVTVKSSEAHAVAISGAVHAPQIYSIFAPTTLLDVISQAGGLAPDAGNIAIVTRGDAARGDAGRGLDPAERTIRVDLHKLISTGDPSLNVTIYPGDKVTVHRAGIVYVVGAVQRPGGFPLSNGRDSMAVLQAVALAEGLKSTAMGKKAIIIRRGEQFLNGREEIPVNLRKILSGNLSDPGLKANDILFIPDSTSKRVLQRGAEAAVQIATGVVIWGRY